MWRNEHCEGFSLVEIMITLFIISMLLTLSIPYQSQHVLQQHRMNAEICLLKINSALEQYFLANNSYAGADLEKLGFTEVMLNQHYQIRICNATADNFKIVAQPVNWQERDKQCATLTLNAKGEKTISGKGDVATCW
jgi:type IV pilus assembly protein PilE